MSQNSIDSNSWTSFFADFSRSLAALFIGLLIGCLIAATVGESPFLVLNAIVDGAIGSAYDRGMTLYYWSILLASGLSVAIPLSAGVFNIGGEGQMTIGALCAAITGVFISIENPVVAGFAAIAAAILGAMFWGMIAAAIRSFRGGHEVISSIMLNFIASALSAWIVINFIQAKDSQNPETSEILPAFQLQKIASFDHAPVTTALVWVILAAFLFMIAQNRSRAGIRLKSVLESPDAADVAGYNVANVRFWAFTFGAACSGLAGATMVLADSFRFRVDMIEGFGFLGIPVALLGRGKASGVATAAFLMAFLHHGASNLDLESSKVNRDLAQIMEAIVVICVVLLPAWKSIIKKVRGDLSI
jgi:simple sugar transport system permease protein